MTSQPSLPSQPRCYRHRCLGDGTDFAPAAPKEGFDSIPLWAADMSFATAPSVTRAMHERIDHPFFGYYFESDAYYQAIIDWHRSRKGVSQNVVSMHALIGAYSDEGATWADELCQVLSENARYAHHKLSSYPGVTCAHPEGTYVLLADCRAWCDEHGVSYADFPRLGWDVGVTWHDGRLFEYPGCVRLAVSVPHSQVIEAFDRLDRYVFC